MRRIIETFKNKQTLMSFIKYLIVGGSSFLLDYLLFYLLFRKMNIDKVVSNSISIFIAFWFNFFLNRLWSFKSDDKVVGQLLKYVGLMLFNMLFSNAFIYIINSNFGTDPVILKVIAMSIIVIWNFILYKTVIFKKKRKIKN